MASFINAQGSKPLVVVLQDDTDLYKQEPNKPNTLLLGGAGHVIPEVHTYWADCIETWIRKENTKIIGLPTTPTP